MADHTAKRPKHLYVTPETHREVKIEAAHYGVEMGCITEAALAAWQEMDDKTRQRYVMEHSDETA